MVTNNMINDKAMFHYLGIHMLLKHNRLTHKSSAIDVGLGDNIEYTLEYAKLFQNLYAFDANKICYNNAVKKSSKFQNIHYYNCFLSDNNEYIEFFENNVDRGHSTRYIHGLANKDHLWKDYNIKKTKSCTLDEILFSKITNLDFIKIDAECSDVEVILGATELIKTWRPIIQWEHMHKKQDVIKEFAVIHNYKFKEYIPDVYFLIP